MADGLTISVDAKEVLALLDRLSASAQFVTREVCLDTAKRIVAEAQRRVARATGVTETGIHWELTRDGKGYVVLGYQAGKQEPVDYWLQYGTKYMRSRPFFFSSALLEEGPHLRRLIARMQQWLDNVGR